MMYLKLVPNWVWALLVGALVVFGAYKYGQHDRQQDWDAAVERGKAVVEQLQKDAKKVTVKIQTKVEYRDRIIEKQGATRTIVRNVFVPTDSGNLSGGFRLFHDAAANDTIPDSTRIADAAPAPVTDVADTINGNYQLCHQAYARVEAWQEWYTEQKAIWDETNGQ